jgi:hypothetical protein
VPYALVRDFAADLDVDRTASHAATAAQSAAADVVVKDGLAAVAQRVPTACSGSHPRTIPDGGISLKCIVHVCSS